MFPTLRRHDQVLPGLGEQVAAAGVTPTGYHASYDARRVFSRRLDPSERFVPRLATSLAQATMEKIVFAECAAAGVQFRWDCPVAGLDGSPDGVMITLSSGEQIAASYVIGADGARSVVRKAIGVTMEGVTDETPFIIVDVDERPDGTTCDISSKALRQMRGTDRITQVKRAIASRLAPRVWPAGVWLANGPLQFPVPRPGSRNYY
jgi:3-(3-hydroxy-phenyl)propionate hydroxylase